jgi:hypothetical protein
MPFIPLFYKSYFKVEFYSVLQRLKLNVGQGRDTTENNIQYICSPFYIEIIMYARCFAIPNKDVYNRLYMYKDIKK